MKAWPTEIHRFVVEISVLPAMYPPDADDGDLASDLLAFLCIAEPLPDWVFSIDAVELGK